MVSQQDVVLITLIRIHFTCQWFVADYASKLLNIFYVLQFIVLLCVSHQAPHYVLLLFFVLGLARGGCLAAAHSGVLVMAKALKQRTFWGAET